jgi:hypothetical protein
LGAPEAGVRPQAAGAQAGLLGGEVRGRVPLGVVAVEQARPGPSGKHGGELPDQVVHVLDASVGALRRERRHHVRGVAGQEHPPGAEPVGDPHGRLPRLHAEDLDVDVGTDQPPELAGPVRLVHVTREEQPLFGTVDRREPAGQLLVLDLAQIELPCPGRSRPGRRGSTR